MSEIILSKKVQELLNTEALDNTIASVLVSAFTQNPTVSTTAPYTISSTGKVSVMYRGASNTLNVTPQGFVLGQDIEIRNTTNVTVTHMVLEFYDTFGSKLGHIIVPLDKPIKSAQHAVMTNVTIPISLMDNESVGIELASYFAYTQPIFKDSVILSTSRHQLKSFFRNMVAVGTPHLYTTDIIVADNLSGAYGDNRDALLTSDFTTVSGVNLINMQGIEDTDDLRDTDLTPDMKVFRSKFMNRSFMFVKDYGYYGVKVVIDSSADVSNIQTASQTISGFVITMVSINAGYNIYIASTGKPIIRIDGSSVFIYSATKADDLMIAVGDALGDVQPFVGRLRGLKNVYQSQSAHGNIITKSYSLTLDGTPTTLVSESGVYMSPKGDIPTQIITVGGDTYIQFYNRLDWSNVTKDRYIDPNLNLRLWDDVVFNSPNTTANVLAMYDNGVAMSKAVSISNGKATAASSIASVIGASFGSTLVGAVNLEYFGSIIDKANLTQVNPLVIQNSKVKVTASSVGGDATTYGPISAFDGKRESYWMSGSGTFNPNGSEYLEIELLTGARTPNQYTINPGTQAPSLQSWRVQCLDSQGNWVTLDERLNQTLTNNTSLYFSFTNTIASTKFRLVILKGSTYGAIGNFNLFEYITPSQANINAAIDAANKRGTNISQLFVKVSDRNLLKGNYLSSLDTSPTNINQTVDCAYLRPNVAFDAYVSPYGSDTTGVGSISSPFKTVTKAVAAGYRVIGLLPGVYDEKDYGVTICDSYSAVHSLFPTNVATFNQAPDYKTSGRLEWNAALDYFYTTAGIKNALYISSVWGKESVIIVTRQGGTSRDYPIFGSIPNTILANVTMVRLPTTRTDTYSVALARLSSNVMMANVRFVIDGNYSYAYNSYNVVLHSCTIEAGNTVNMTQVSDYFGTHTIV